MSLNTEQQQAIKCLGEILIYGNENISKAELHPLKTRPKKLVLFYAMAATQSYSEAILKLMKPENIYDKAAEVLLRSLVETYINVNYIYSSKSKDNAVVFIIESLKEKIDFAKKHKALWDKYPLWKLKFGDIKKASDWDNFLKKQGEDILAIEKNQGKTIPPLPGLLDRAIAFDSQYVKKRKPSVSEAQAKRRLQRKSLEKYYVLYYKYFSQIAHLTMPGLEQFTRIDSNGKMWIDFDGPESSIDRIVPITYVIYLAILSHFLKQFHIFDADSFKTYKNNLKNF